MYGEALRLLIPSACNNTYLNTGTLGPSPTPVMAAVEAAETQWVHSGPGHTPLFHAARDQAEIFGSRLETAFPGGRIALTENNSAALLRILWGIRFKARDEIIVTNHEHGALLMSVGTLAKRFRLKVHVISVEDPVGISTQVEKLMNDRTRLVAMSHVSYLTGWRLPVEKVSRITERYKYCRLLVDGAQALGNIPVNFSLTGADYYVFCGYKWMMAPTGLAGVWVRDGRMAELATVWPNERDYSVENLASGHFKTTPESGQSLEYGTRIWTRVVGWALMWDYFEEEGFIHQSTYQQRLANEAIQRISAECPEISVRVPPNLDTGMTALTALQCLSMGEKLAPELWRRKIFVKPLPQGIR
ncbi:MAG: aminotransferase class V-fold PLP-dependent enzyme, partial [Firmicutes bacterium]|nr:aminotransferase class V-fold PLP-dependent enzyme [Bacillota bacterium]